MKVVEQFKRRILDLAIRGKLVPQDPNDEPASILLERIKAEKDKLVKAGKIKKEKSPSEIVIGSDGAAYEKFGSGGVFNAETQRRREGWCTSSRAITGGPTSVSAVNVPFEIPKGWAWARLGEIGSWKAGATPSRNVTDYYAGGVIPWLKTGDLNDGVVTYIPETITEKALAETSVRLNPVGTVLIAMYGATIGKIGLLGIAATTNQACCACIVERQIYNRYLFFYLMAQREHFRSLGGGGAQPNISKDIITSYPFPVPPLAEQRRIVAKIDELFAIVDSMGNAADGLSFAAKRLGKKILDLAIRGKLVPQDPNDEPASELVKRIAASHKSPSKNHGEEPIAPPFEIPDSWEWVWLGVISCLISSKKNQILTKEIKQTGKWAVVSQGQNLVDGYSDSDEKVIQDVPIILFGDHTRNVKYLDFPFVVGADGTKLIQSFVDTKWLYYWVLYASSKIRDRGYARHWNELIHIPVPLPPLAEQKRIVAKIEELRAVIKPLTM